MNCFHLANASGASCIEFLAGIFSRHNQTGQKWLGWILNKQIKTQTNEQTKKKSKQNITKQKQNKTKQKTSKLNKEWLLKKKKKKRKPSNLNEEWPLNESSMYCLKSQSRKEIFPETIYLSRQLFYAIFLAKTALLVYSCTSFLAQL